MTVDPLGTAGLSCGLCESTSRTPDNPSRTSWLHDDGDACCSQADAVGVGGHAGRLVPERQRAHSRMTGEISRRSLSRSRPSNVSGGVWSSLTSSGSSGSALTSRASIACSAGISGDRR